MAGMSAGVPGSKSRRRKASTTPNRYVALLRGINVGGANMLPMKDLTGMFVSAGCDNVQTYIQSGNVIFDAAPDVAGRLAGVIEKQIAKRYGLRIPVVLRTAEELGCIARTNPYLEQGSAEDILHIVFLADLPAP